MFVDRKRLQWHGGEGFWSRALDPRDSHGICAKPVRKVYLTQQRDIPCITDNLLFISTGILRAILVAPECTDFNIKFQEFSEALVIIIDHYLLRHRNLESNSRTPRFPQLPQISILVRDTGLRHCPTSPF